VRHSGVHLELTPVSLTVGLVVAVIADDELFRVVVQIGDVVHLDPPPMAEHRSVAGLVEPDEPGVGIGEVRVGDGGGHGATADPSASGTAERWRR
jgi:hypothetical protein